MNKLVLVLTLMFAVVVDANAANLAFDDVNAPNLFVSTASLTNQYAAQGIHFGGGGAILNQDGNFGVNAHSGSQFWAFNINAYASGPGTIIFDNLVNNVSIYAAGGHFTGDFTMNAFDANNSLLGGTSITTSDWALLSLAFSGIKSIQLVSSATYYVYDDLGFTNGYVAQTPVPAAVWLFGSALTGLVGFGKRKMVAG